MQERDVTRAVYRDVLEQHLVSGTQQMFCGNFQYYDDNARTHRARVATEFLRQRHTQLMIPPALSPDCDPIEHLWDELGRAVCARPNPPTNLPDLRATLMEEWDNTPWKDSRTSSGACPDAWRMLSRVVDVTHVTGAP